MSSSPADPTTLAEAVAACREDELFLDALRAIYRDADAEEARGQARCLGGGVCCRFDLAGHRLYASTGELALLSAVAPADLSRCRRMRCPYQRGPRCTARAARPLGCRVFFCEPKSRDASADLYERMHRRITRLHERHDIAYHYAELTAALTEILAPA